MPEFEVLNLDFLSSRERHSRDRDVVGGTQMDCRSLDGRGRLDFQQCHLIRAYSAGDAWFKRRLKQGGR